MSPEKNLSLYVFHEDQVSLMPKGCKLLGSTQNCKIASFSKGNHIFTTQAHPEFDYMFMKTIVEKYEEMLGPKIFKNAIRFYRNGHFNLSGLEKRAFNIHEIGETHIQKSEICRLIDMFHTYRRQWEYCSIIYVTDIRFFNIF